MIKFFWFSKALFSNQNDRIYSITTFMLSFKKAIFKLNFRTITSIKNISLVNSFFSKIDSIMKTKNSLLIKTKKRSFDVKNKRLKQEFDDQSTRRLKYRFKHIVKKNLQTR